MQRAETDAHESYTRPGDTVAVVGVGSGVSTITAAKHVGADGRVIGYEAAPDMAAAARESMELNAVADRVDIVAKPVTDIQNNVWGNRGTGDSVAPTDIPRVDVLELDCEGAELEILDGLSQRPRVITVEVHPNYGVPVDAVTTWFAANDYDVVNKKVVNDQASNLAWITATRQ